MEISILLWVAFVGLAIYYYFCRQSSHFEKMKIPQENPWPFLGNMGPAALRRVPLVKHTQYYYNKFSAFKYVGFHEFMTPVIFVRDPELFVSMAVKNFDNFIDHRAFLDEKMDPLMAKNIFSLHGDRWREMRKLVSPTFTSSKMKNMFVLIDECANNFASYLVTEAGTNGKEYEMKALSSRYAIDVVATCAFGITIDSMKDPNNVFYKLARKTMNFDGILSTKFFLLRNFPKLSTFFGVRLFGPTITNFFTNIVAESIKMREEKGITRPDMIQLMMDASKEHNNCMDVSDITAQAFVFFFAGFDATSTLMSYTSHEIAVNKDVQETLVKEIEDVLEQTQGKPTYDAIINMKYLDAVVNETLRMYPLTPFLDRVCVKPFEMPPTSPDAKPIVIPPGTSIWLPLYPIHHDPNYYAEPEKFDPTRFLDKKINQSVYLPFGIGPRICIGNRFALLQTKVMLFYFLARCELEPCKRTNIPVEFSKTSFLMLPKGGFWLKIRKRQQRIF